MRKLQLPRGSAKFFGHLDKWGLKYRLAQEQMAALWYFAQQGFHMLHIEELESRSVPSANSTLANGILTVQADNQGDYLVASQPKPNTVEIFDAKSNTAQDFTGVTQINFVGGKGSDTFYNNTSLPSMQKANNNPANKTVLVGGSGNDTLVGGDGDVYESDPGGNNTLIGGKRLSNIFAGPGNNSITGGSGFNAIYDILGTDTIDGGTGTGYLLVNAQSTVKASANEQVVTFFQTVFTNTKSPVLLQKDVNGNGILYLLPQVQTAVSFVISNGAANTVNVSYADVNGVQSFSFQKNQISWLAFFGGPGGNQVTNNTEINSVFYGGKGNDVIIGGFGINVLKGHSGQDIVFGRGRMNDLSVGAGAASTIYAGPHTNVIRNNTAQINTIDYNVSVGDVVIGVPASIDRQYVGIDPTAINADYENLWDYLNRYRI